MFLFNLNTSSTEGGVKADTSPSCMTLYCYKIYEDGNLVCHFVPAVYKGIVGLYDRVRKTFNGSGTSVPFNRVEKKHKKGDVNNDGFVDISDIVAVINHISITSYWSSTLKTIDYAECLTIYGSGYSDWGGDDRTIGRCVRPVAK